MKAERVVFIVNYRNTYKTNNFQIIMDIEEPALRQQESWLKRAFKEEWPTMGNHLVAAAVATTAATGISYISKHFMDSDAAISGLATVVDSTSYWSVFLPQLVWRDRKRLCCFFRNNTHRY